MVHLRRLPTAVAGSVTCALVGSLRGWYNRPALRQRFGFQWGLQQQLVAYISASIKTQGGYKTPPLPPSCKRPSKRLESLVSRPDPLESPFFRLDRISFRYNQEKLGCNRLGRLSRVLTAYLDFFIPVTVPAVMRAR